MEKFNQYSKISYAQASKFDDLLTAYNNMKFMLGEKPVDTFLSKAARAVAALGSVALYSLTTKSLPIETWMAWTVAFATLFDAFSKNIANIQKRSLDNDAIGNILKRFFIKTNQLMQMNIKYSKSVFDLNTGLWVPQSSGSKSLLQFLKMIENFSEVEMPGNIVHITKGSERFDIDESDYNKIIASVKDLKSDRTALRVIELIITGAAGSIGLERMKTGGGTFSEDTEPLATNPTVLKRDDQYLKEFKSLRKKGKLPSTPPKVK